MEKYSVSLSMTFPIRNIFISGEECCLTSFSQSYNSSKDSGRVTSYTKNTQWAPL